MMNSKKEEENEILDKLIHILFFLVMMFLMIECTRIIDNPENEKYSTPHMKPTINPTLSISERVQKKDMKREKNVTNNIPS